MVVTNLQRIEGIVREQQYRKIGRFLVDMQTANTILLVLNSLSEPNRTKYINIINSDISRASSIAWKLVK